VLAGIQNLGHEAVTASPNTGVNSITGEGLADALKPARLHQSDSRQRLDDEGFLPMNLHTRQSRRQFIKRTLATTGTLWLTIASRQLEIHDRRQIDSDALKKLRAQLKGGLILPTDPGYEAARRVYFWNPDTRRRRTVCPRR
jgi:hypothetical protein